MKTATTTSTLRALAHAGNVPDPEIPEKAKPAPIERSELLVVGPTRRTEVPINVPRLGSVREPVISTSASRSLLRAATVRH